MKPFDPSKLRAGLRKAVADAASSQTKMDITRDPVTGLINGMTTTPVGDANVAKAGEEAIEKVVDAVEDLQKQATVTAGEVGQMVADAVVEKAREVAETIIGDMVAKATEDLEAFRRPEDEFEDDDEMDDDDLEAAAEDIADAVDTIERSLAPMSDEISKVLAIQKEQARQVLLLRSQIDALASLTKELGSVENVREFFKFARQVPLTDDHPFLNDPRLRVLVFPDSGGGKVSTSTSAEYEEDDNPDVQTDQMADHHPGYNVRRPKVVEEKARQSMHDRLPADLPNPDASQPQDLTGVGGSGGQDFRAHRNPHPDAVLMSEYQPRKRVMRSRGPVRRRGLWSGRS